MQKIKAQNVEQHKFIAEQNKQGYLVPIGEGPYKSGTYITNWLMYRCVRI